MHTLTLKKFREELGAHPRRAVVSFVDDTGEQTWLPDFLIVENGDPKVHCFRPSQNVKKILEGLENYGAEANIFFGGLGYSQFRRDPNPITSITYEQSGRGIVECRSLVAVA